MHIYTYTFISMVKLLRHFSQIIYKFTGKFFYLFNQLLRKALYVKFSCYDLGCICFIIYFQLYDFVLHGVKLCY